jgi:putative restriction endonuclease
MGPYIALTDKAWFDFLSSWATDGRVDEVNFWSPTARAPMRRMHPGHPVFFRLKKPWYAIAGYGFFAHWSLLDLDAVWEFFGPKNGDSNKLGFLTRLGQYRKQMLLDPRANREPLACTILRAVRFWPESRWIPWGDDMGWPRHTQQGRAETDPERSALLLGEITADQQERPAEFVDRFSLIETDDRRFVGTDVVRREGQGAFRARLLDVYQRQCAITGEHTEPVLDATHIQPYLGPRSNHVQNGLVLTKEFHALFDRGLVTVTPDYEVRVSPRLRSEWRNGHRYYPFDGKRLMRVPEDERHRPSAEALVWHSENVFRT